MSHRAAERVPSYRLQLKDGRYLRCYFWSSRRAIFAESKDGTWWGSMDDALKIQDEWGAGSCPLKLVPKEVT